MDGEPVDLYGIPDAQTTGDWAAFDPDAVPLDAVGHYLYAGALHTVSTGAPAPGPGGHRRLRAVQRRRLGRPAHRAAVLPRRRPVRRLGRHALLRQLRRRPDGGADRRDPEHADRRGHPVGGVGGARRHRRGPRARGRRTAGGERPHAAGAGPGRRADPLARRRPRRARRGRAGRPRPLRRHRRPVRGRQRGAARPPGRRPDAVPGGRRGVAGQRQPAVPRRERGRRPRGALRRRGRRLGARRPSRRPVCPASPPPSPPHRPASRWSTRAARSGSCPAGPGSPSCAEPSHCPGRRPSTRSEPPSTDPPRVRPAAATRARLAGWAVPVVGALADLVLPRTCAGCGLPGWILCRRCAALLARPRRRPRGGSPGASRRPPPPAPTAVRCGRPSTRSRSRAGPNSPAPWGRRWRSPRRGRVRRARRPRAGPAGAGAQLARGPAHPRPRPRARADRPRGGGAPGRRGAGARGAAAAPAGSGPRLRGPVRGRPPGEPGGTFRAPGEPPRGALLVLVDDVVTSGATLTEAAAALAARPARAPPVLAAVVAATPRPTRSGFRGRPAGCPEAARERPRTALGRLSGPGSRD